MRETRARNESHSYKNGSRSVLRSTADRGDSTQEQDNLWTEKPHVKPSSFFTPLFSCPSFLSSSTTFVLYPSLFLSLIFFLQYDLSMDASVSPLHQRLLRVLDSRTCIVAERRHGLKV